MATYVPGSSVSPSVSVAPPRVAAPKAPAGPTAAQTAAWYRAAAARANTPAMPQVTSPAPGLNPVAGAPIVAGGAAPAAGGTIDQQFNNLLALLHTNVANAHTGIGAVGNQLNTQLAGLRGGVDAQSAQVAHDIAAQYATQRQSAGADQAALLADLQRQGANTGVLQATNNQQNANLSGEQQRQANLLATLKGVADTSMAGRQAGAQQTTAGTQQQLTTKEALLASQIEAQRMQALQAAAAQAQMMAAARSGGGGRGGGGGRRGGGGYGGGSGGGLTFTEAKDIYGMLKGTGATAAPPDYWKYVQGAGIDYGNATAAQRAQPWSARATAETNDLLAALNNGASAADLLATFNARRVGPGSASYQDPVQADRIRNFLTQAALSQQRDSRASPGYQLNPNDFATFLHNSHVKGF